MRDTIHTRGFVGRTAMFAMVAAGVLAPPKGTLAQPTVRAYLEQPEVAGREQPIALTLEFSGVEDHESITVPVDLGLDELRGLPGRGVLIWASNTGAPQRSEVFRVVYAIMGDLGPGPLRIGPLRVTADGHDLETELVTLLVAEAGEASVRARVDPSRVKVGDNFDLIVELLGGGEMTHLPEVPYVFDFAESGGGIGGSDDSYSFTMLATTPGEFLIPPIPVRIGDRVLETEPVTLVITDEPVDVSVQANILSRLIWVGGEFVVSVEVDGVSELDEEPVLPATVPFAERVETNQAQGRARFSVSGRRSVERNFGFRALTAGSFEIGPVRVMADGRTFMTDPISLVVTESPAGEAEPPGNLHFMAVPDSRREERGVYVGEPVFLSYSILHEQRWRAPPLTGTVSWPSFNDFQLVDLRGYWSRQARRATVGGRSHDVVLLRRVALLPVEDGDLAIGPAAVEVQFESERQFRSRPPELLTYDSFILSTDPVELQVLPLPEEGRPESFRGHVGTLKVTSWVDRTSMAAGDTLTLEVEVDVEGYMRGLPDPEIDFPDGFEVLPPRTRSAIPESSDGLSGMSTYIYRLVAVGEGTWEVPAVEMSYFDPEAAEYGTSRGQPFTITVVPAGEEAR